MKTPSFGKKRRSFERGILKKHGSFEKDIEA